MKLHNTLSKQTEPFKPIESNLVRIYSCGPTVYDHIHIGNLSSFIVTDTLRRVLGLSGNKVKHIMNLTDVDDKTIRRSQEKFGNLEARSALEKLTDTYTKVFLSDMGKVGNDVAAYEFTKATEFIPAMQKLIERLRSLGFAYIADDGVYFSIDKYKASGKKYGQLSDITQDSTSEARINNDEYDKTSAHDFALWKKQKNNEPSWELEINGQPLTGRPGWHIECSAMSVEKLGQPFDIHTGGVDLIFPHHENEIAQSTAGHDSSEYASFFVHNEHMLIDDKKMSKSLNNFYTLQDLEDKGYNPLAFRLLVLQSHYRSQAHFSWDNLTAAQNHLKNFQAMADLRWQKSEDKVYSGPDYAQYQKNMQQFLEDDLDTPQALAVLSQAEANSISPITKVNNVTHEFQSFLEFIDNSLGLGLLDSKDIGTAQKQIISDREQARATQDWTKSDELREKLVIQGVGLRDTENGTIWYRL